MIGIYRIRNIITNEVYIGQSVDIDRRWTTHKRELRCNRHENQHLQDSYNKYGSDAFEYTVLEQCSADILLEREKYHANLYPNKYNMCDAGGGLNNPTEDVSRKISKNLTGNKNGMFNVHLFGELNGMYGKHHSNESRSKISEKAKQRIGAASNRSRPVQASTGEIFYTMYDACEWCNLKDGSSINKCRKGETKSAGKHPQTGEKLTWMYRDDLKLGVTTSPDECTG